ncbi:MAG: HNH endonuclease [Clostridiales bacterium]|jgi:hypothetical protein|nr:HNH endonuclease [Clostridiales bacterium]
MNPLAIIFIVWIGIIIYRNVYFNSDEFASIKKSVEDLTNDFNELNEYADFLSINLLGGQTKQTFVGEISNESRWGYKHSGLFSRENKQYIYHCSRSVVSNAQLNGYKYICKYFNIPIDETHRNYANDMLNNFNSYEESRELLRTKRNNLFDKIKNNLPFLIKILKKSLYKKLGLTELDLVSVIYPQYVFSYTSSGGNSGLSYTLKLNPNNLEGFMHWLDDSIKYKKSAQYQRVIMTPQLREKIKKRDNYACKLCNVSIKDEPTLLLEIDHIIPISKGGLSVEENLQCLCWRCNRKKGAKICV